jgi:hypothetical protein
MCGVFAEFERGILRERINAGIARARRKGTKSGLAIGRASHRGCQDRAGAAWSINSHRGGGDRYQRWEGVASLAKLERAA